MTWKLGTGENIFLGSSWFDVSLTAFAKVMQGGKWGVWTNDLKKQWIQILCHKFLGEEAGAFPLLYEDYFGEVVL